VQWIAASQIVKLRVTGMSAAYARASARGSGLSHGCFILPAQYVLRFVGGRNAMSTQNFFELTDQTEETVFAALEEEMRAAVDKARVKAMHERVPGLSESDDELWPLLRKLESAPGRP
jgi:hypothetical protein